MRLDKHLLEKFPEFSRNQMTNLIKSGSVLVNNVKVKAGYVVKLGDKIDFNLPAQEDALKAEKFDLEVLYEDDACFAINKPAGLIVHGGEGKRNFSGTLANALFSKIGKNFPASMRPGIVHRLDKDTSGVMVIAKTQRALENLVEQFKNREVKKVYFALVLGKLPLEEGIIEGSIGRHERDRKRMAVTRLNGKEALSLYKLKALFKCGQYFLSLVEVRIKSGRTHQIRVHFSSIGYPVVGDDLYGSKKINKYFEKKFLLNRQFLHAYVLGFKSPKNNKELNIKAKLPDDLNSVMENLKVYQI